MNSNENIFKQDWNRLATVRQLRGICECYDLMPSKNATREDLLCLLEEKNVQLEFTSYNGHQVQFHGAIIHWMKDPEASSTSDPDSSNNSNDCCRFGCPDSDDCSDKMNNTPTDTNMDISVAQYESYPPSDFDVQHEEEVF